MSNTPERKTSSLWKVAALLFFGSATAICLYIGNCYRSYYLVLGMCLFGLYNGILSLFIPSEDDEQYMDKSSSIRNSGGMDFSSRPTTVQYIFAFSCIAFMLWILFFVYRLCA